MRKSSFIGKFFRLNGLDKKGNPCLVFHKGMLYQSMVKWWHRKEWRLVPHEGLDILFYRNGVGDIVPGAPQLKVPAMYAGTVFAVIDDMLGKTIFLRHRFTINERIVHSIYAHIEPDKNIEPGLHVQEGEVIASISGPFADTVTVAPHLHLSMALIPEDFSANRLDWKAMNRIKDIELLDPLAFLHDDYEIIQ